MRGLTKGLLGLVGAFALVGVIVWAWPLVIPPAPPRRNPRLAGHDDRDRCAGKQERESSPRPGRC